MSTMISLDVQKRELKGKGASRRLRKEDIVPGIIYGNGFTPVQIQVAHKELLRASQMKSFYAHVVELKVEGKAHKVMVKDIQRHAYKNKLVHVDFQNISDDEVLTFELPITYLNAASAAGVKLGGQLTISKKAITVRCQAKNIPETLEVDLSALAVNQILHISDIKLPEGVESYDLMLGESHDLALASIHKSGGSSDESSEEASAE